MPWATFSGHRLVCGRTVWILTMMQSCASVAKLPGGGPILLVGIGATFEYGFPPPRIVNPAVGLKDSTSAE